jgi:hypothetical protein
MPRACEPGLTFELWLDFDEAKPIEERPVFYCMTLSMSEKKRAGEAIDSLATSKDSNELYGRVISALSICLSGWRNMRNRRGDELLFSAESLSEVLTLQEAIELVRKTLNAQFVSAEDKKKQDSSA